MSVKEIAALLNCLATQVHAAHKNTTNDDLSDDTMYLRQDGEIENTVDLDGTPEENDSGLKEESSTTFPIPIDVNYFQDEKKDLPLIPVTEPDPLTASSNYSHGPASRAFSAKHRSRVVEYVGVLQRTPDSQRKHTAEFKAMPRTASRSKRGSPPPANLKPSMIHERPLLSPLRLPSSVALPNVGQDATQSPMAPRSRSRRCLSNA
ncbi:hypothetical protein EIP91_012098 [Steccherinum ochraceum]|uniref:Uncharacterized protein n=1 Tax=Steccherinum ochraceum TaxID=92696 RepID=A0A4R0RQI1_9APHY|nr:hypothetical protein EIP91_012098 [Steccherinum ochraceum]